MRILICGSRDADQDYCADKAREILWNKGVYHVCNFIHGGANGADRAADLLSEQLSETHGCLTEAWVFDADWDTYGKAAGPIRNAVMLDKGQPNLVIAFPMGVSRGISG